MAVTLQTRRITLRAPRPEDDAPLVALYSDPETMRHLPELHEQPWTLQRMAARRESLARSFIIVLASSRAVIGQAGFRSLTPDKRGELGLIVAQGQQGRGLAWDVHLLLLTLAFESLDLEAVDWVTSKENQGMRAVLTKMGCSEVDHEEADWIKYTLSKEDWSECKRLLCENVDRYSAGSRIGA